MLALLPPSRSFSRTPLLVSQVNSADLLRISGHSSGEPNFGRAASNRFDDYRLPKSKRFGTCYFGLTFSVAFAETVLHDEYPLAGHFPVSPEKLESRYVVQFSGANLTLADLTGAALKRSGADSSISSIADVDFHERIARRRGSTTRNRRLAALGFDRTDCAMPVGDIR